MNRTELARPRTACRPTTARDPGARSVERRDGAAARPLDRPTLPLDVDPIDRMLLTTDGTVTTLLEACTGGPIVTTLIRQSGSANHDVSRNVTAWGWHPDPQLLGLASSERVRERQVVLRGARSGVGFVLAEALVVPDRLPQPVADRLERPGGSLGRVLADGDLATRRRIVQIEAVRAGAAADHLGVRPESTLARRTYTIAIEARPVAAVTEWLVPGRLAATVAAGGGRGGSGYVADL